MGTADDSPDNTTTDTSSNGWLSTLAGLGTTFGGVFTALTNSQTAAANQKAAQTNASLLTSILPIAVIGIVLVIVLALFMRRK